MAKYKKMPVKILQFIKKPKTLIVILVLVLLGGLGYWRLAGNKKGDEFVTVKVSYGDVMETISASGNIEPVQYTTLTFKTQGYVEKCKVKVGDKVKTGQVLASEQGSDLQTQLDQAEASLQSATANYNKAVASHAPKIERAKAALEQTKNSLGIAKTTLDRDKQLLEAGAISQADFDAANNSYQSAQNQYVTAQTNLAEIDNSYDLEIAAAQVKSAQAQLNIARNNMDNLKIVAPFDGYVSKITGNVGQWTGGGAQSTSSTSTSQFSIELSSTKLQLKAEINEADISKVKTGQEATFTVDTYPNKTFTGKLVSLAPNATTVSNVQMYDSVIAIDDYSKLRGGLPASINIVISSAKNVLNIPQTALSFARTYAAQMQKTAGGNTGFSKIVRTNQTEQENINNRNNTNNKSSSRQSILTGRSPVFVLQNGKPVMRLVQTGLSDDVNIEIKSGLQEGDLVILSQNNLTGNSSSSSSNSNSSSRTRSSGIPLGGPGGPRGF